MLPPQLLQWLSQVSQQHYSHPDTVYQHSAYCLEHHPQLRPRTRVHTDDNGTSSLLLCLYGSLPAVINNHRYNIPVEIWISLQYPSVSPMAYVVPTTKMLLNPGNHVDANGRCYLPYLANWTPQASNLSQLCTELSLIFATHSPVYAKPAPSSPIPSSPQPALPPKQQPTTHHTITSPPPVPPIPLTIKRQHPPPMTPHMRTTITTEQPNFMDSTSSSDKIIDIKRQQALQQLITILNSLQTHTITPQIQQFQQNTSQIEQSISQFDKIFNFESTQLKSIESDIIKDTEILNTSISQSHNTLKTISKTPQPHPDDTIIAESIPQAQLYELVSQDLAINDTLTALNTAFSQGKIPLQSLLRHTRQLAREQFDKRSLIRKISQELGVQI